MKIEKISNGLLKLIIDKSGNDYDVIKKNVLSSYKDRKIDGFRPGKAPEDVIYKTFKKEVEEKIISSIFEKEYKVLIEENNLKPLIVPVLKEVKYTNDSVYAEFELAVEPEFEVPQYKGLNIDEEAVEVTEKEVDERVAQLLENAKKKVALDTKILAEEGHEAVIDFDGYIDGVQFEGGKAENYPLVLGTKTFVDTFEEQIIGHKVGDKFDVVVTFPENYAEHLKGKEATFKVELKGLSKFEKRELNDEFAKESGSESVEAFKENIKETILKGKKENARNEKINKILEKLSEEVKYEVPEILLNTEIEQEIKTLSAQMQQYGMTFEQYLQMTNKTFESLVEEIKPRSIQNVKIRLALTKIMELEKITFDESEIKEEIKNYASMYQMTEENFVKMVTEQGQYQDFKAHVIQQVVNKKIMELLYKNN